MLIRGASIARINPPIYRERLLDLANHLCVINLAVCMIMLQLFNSPLIKTAGEEFISLNFSYFPRPLCLVSPRSFTTYLLCFHSEHASPHSLTRLCSAFISRHKFRWKSNLQLNLIQMHVFVLSIYLFHVCVFVHFHGFIVHILVLLCNSSPWLVWLFHPDCCVHCILACLFCEFLTLCNMVVAQASCGACTSEACCCCCCADDLGDDCNCPCDMDCGIMDACCESSDCLEICMECCGICFPT